MIEVYFDGCCLPRNPGGHAGSGFLIINGPNTFKGSSYIGYGAGMTNNLAEHHGANQALKKLLEWGHQDEVINFYGDSMMAIMQLSGKWGFKKGAYIPTLIESKSLIKKFKKIGFEWIPREENYEADYLSTLEVYRRFPQMESRITWNIGRTFESEMAVKQA